MKIFENYKKSLKSTETEDWLDLRVVRPFSYLLALVFDKFGTHPNTVTILSMIIGVASCWGYMHGSYFYEGREGLVLNVIACLLLLAADILDCTDGQLARISGKRSKWGRILDGLAGPVWFVPIYLVLVYRFYMHHSIEFAWFGIPDTEQNTLIATTVVLILALVSGFWGMSGQQRLADYYIQIHLYMLKGEKGCELDTSESQQQDYEALPSNCNPVWRMFQKSYINYTKMQEAATPRFQTLMQALREKYGTASAMPVEIRERLLKASRRIMPWNAMLTFNFRTGIFFVFCLLDLPAWNFAFEIVMLGLLTKWIVYTHERECTKVYEAIRLNP